MAIVWKGGKIVKTHRGTTLKRVSQRKRRERITFIPARYTSTSSCKPSVPFHPSLSLFLVQCNFKLIMHRTTRAVGSRRVIFRQFTPSWPKEAANKPASISRHAIPRTRYLWYPELGLPSAYTCIPHVRIPTDRWNTERRSLPCVAIGVESQF